MSDIDDMIDQIKIKRDEMRVQVKLASMDIKDEWAKLDAKTDKFMEEAKLSDTGAGLSRALGEVGSELKAGYERIRDAIKES